MNSKSILNELLRKSEGNMVMDTPMSMPEEIWRKSKLILNAFKGTLKWIQMIS